MCYNLTIYRKKGVGAWNHKTSSGGFSGTGDQKSLRKASELHPKKHGDLISSIHECEQLTKTQVNIMNRTAKRY